VAEFIDFDHSLYNRALTITASYANQYPENHWQRNFVPASAVDEPATLRLITAELLATQRALAQVDSEDPERRFDLHVGKSFKPVRKGGRIFIEVIPGFGINESDLLDNPPIPLTWAELQLYQTDDYLFAAERYSSLAGQYSHYPEAKAKALQLLGMAYNVQVQIIKLVDEAEHSAYPIVTSEGILTHILQRRALLLTGKCLPSRENIPSEIGFAGATSLLDYFLDDSYLVLVLDTEPPAFRPDKIEVQRQMVRLQQELNGGRPEIADRIAFRRIPLTGIDVEQDRQIFERYLTESLRQLSS